MSKVRITAVWFGILAMTAISGVARKNETELAMFAGAPDGFADISSEGYHVIVGTNVWTYSPDDILLYLSEKLVADTEISPGEHWGRARCLKKNGPEGGRLDFYFDLCSGDDLSTCTYRLIVRFGIYDRNTDVVIFDPGSMRLYTTEGQLLKGGDASFSIAFVPGSGGNGGDTELEQGGKKCGDGLDNDGDGLIDCDDPDCSKWCR